MTSSPRSLLALALGLTALGAAPVLAQEAPTVGLVAGGSCTTLVDILGDGGELYALKADGLRHDDWQLDASAKGGARFGLIDGDIAGGLYQVLDNWTRVTNPNDNSFVFVTFPDGGLYVDSGSLSSYNFVGYGLVQQVGDSPSSLPASAGIVLPGTSAGWFADLGAGAEAFPQQSLGGVYLAFAPVAELSTVDLGGCSLGGSSPDPASGAGLIVGYNAYRLEDAGTTPTPAELGAPENWVAYLPFAFGLDGSDGLGTLHDPDGLAYSGDEVMVFHDAPTNGDGSPRDQGSPPDASSAVSYWYAFQPVVAGDIADWSSLSLATLPAADYTADLDGDGLADAVDLDPGAGDGPEFLSPQAAWGRPGLGLTNGGLPLLSRPVFGTPGSCPTHDPLVFEIDDVRVSKQGGGEVRVAWTDRAVDVGPGTSYEVASDLISVMRARGVADAACTSRGLTSTEERDSRALRDDVLYYLVRAVDPCQATPDDTWGRDSTGSARPACR